MNINRIHNLDYLRGISAFLIMIYHFTSWSYGHHSPDTFLGKIGVYGVSIFYVLSGLTMYKVYYENGVELKSFFIKRAFRIYPLLILATMATVVLTRRFDFDLTLLLNITGLFGMLQWDKNIAVGAWSIGNEIVFYLLLPIFILFAKKQRALFWLICACLFYLYVHFAFFIIDPSIAIWDQTFEYMNPMNQAFLFLSGFLIGLFTDKVHVKNVYSILILATALVSFIIYQVDTSGGLIFGWNRIAFTILSILICFSFFKLELTAHKAITFPISKLGEYSYSVYLLHPIVWLSFGSIFKLQHEYRIALSVLLTIVTSYVCYELVEKFFIKKGKQISSLL